MKYNLRLTLTREEFLVLRDFIDYGLQTGQFEALEGEEADRYKTMLEIARRIGV